MMKITRKSANRTPRVNKEEALTLAEDPYKVELITELPADETITVYQQGCSILVAVLTSHQLVVSVYKLLSVAGAGVEALITR